MEEQQVAEGASLPLVEEEHQPVVVTILFRGRLEVGENQFWAEAAPNDQAQTLLLEVGEYR